MPEDPDFPKVSEKVERSLILHEDRPFGLRALWASVGNNRV
jgi:hypothetical protein